MATKKDLGDSKTKHGDPKYGFDGDEAVNLGLDADAPSHPAMTGPYTESLAPAEFSDEYSDPAGAIRKGHGIQTSFPAGPAYGGSAGSGKKFPGSDRGKPTPK